MYSICDFYWVKRQKAHLAKIINFSHPNPNKPRKMDDISYMLSQLYAFSVKSAMRLVAFPSAHLPHIMGTYSARAGDVPDEDSTRATSKNEHPRLATFPRSVNKGARWVSKRTHHKIRKTEPCVLVENHLSQFNVYTLPVHFHQLAGMPDGLL